MENLKIGDKVFITENARCLLGLEEGLVGEIVDCIEQNVPHKIVVSFEENGMEVQRNFFSEGELIKIEEIKVGDIVFFREGISIKELFLNCTLTWLDISTLHCMFFKVTDIQDKYHWEINGVKTYGSVKVTRLHEYMIPISHFTKNREERIGKIEDKQIKNAFK